MAQLGARVAAARRAGIAALAGPFAAWLAAAGRGRRGELRLETSPSGLREVADDRLEEALARTFAERRPREIQAAQTLSGPHRDDLWIGPRGADLRREGSQGEQRTAALALLLAARDHLRARSARPILLLDDVLSELDPTRRRLLLEAVRDGGQTLVTSADPTAPTPCGDAFDAVVRVASGASMADRPRRRRRRRIRRPRPRSCRASGAARGHPRRAAALGAHRRRLAGGRRRPRRRPQQRRCACTRAGVLSVACSSASWAHELSARREDLLARLAAACPERASPGSASRWRITPSAGRVRPPLHRRSRPPRAPPTGPPAGRRPRASRTRASASWSRAPPRPPPRAKVGPLAGEIPANRALNRGCRRSAVLNSVDRL